MEQEQFAKEMVDFADSLGLNKKDTDLALGYATVFLNVMDAIIGSRFMTTQTIAIMLHGIMIADQENLSGKEENKEE